MQPLVGNPAGSAVQRLLFRSTPVRGGGAPRRRSRHTCVEVFGMTWKCCRPFLSALSLLVAGTASAAKLSFSEKGFVDVGALVQAQYRIEQDAAGSGKDPSNDFLLRRARLIISGQFNDNIGFLVATDVSY